MDKKKLSEVFKNFNFKNFKDNKLLWLTPILLWLVGGAVYIYVHQSAKVKKTIQEASVAVGLQKDINYIATRTKASEVFSMSKEELIKSDKNDNFLMKKVKRTLERSDYAKSMGTKDDVPITFDANLNPQINPSATNNLASQEDQPINRISIRPDSLETMEDIKYTLAKIEEDQPSKYAHLEKNRKARLAAAKADNRRRRKALDESTLDVEAAAYRKGLEDHERRYAAFHGEPDYNSELDYNASDNRGTSNNKKPKPHRLQFDTNTGIKDDLGLIQKKVSYSEDPVPINVNYLKEQSDNTPLYAIIDRPQKLKSGDKVRLRITEGGDYKGYLIKTNQILYGICSVSNRIKIQVSSININQRVVRSALEVYDLDGMPGIYVEGADIDVGQEAIREGLREAGSLGIRNPLGNLSLRLGRKANRTSGATIPSGYQVMLYDRNLN